MGEMADDLETQAFQEMSEYEEYKEKLQKGCGVYSTQNGVCNSTSLCSDCKNKIKGIQ